MNFVDDITGQIEYIVGDNQWLRLPRSSLQRLGHNDVPLYIAMEWMLLLKLLLNIYF